MKRTQIAKLTRPRLHQVVPRDRLFRLIDAKREHACVWVVGPPGAGKTTLLASYLNACGMQALWYQMDSGDSDPATFFHYLREAISVHAPRKAKLPPLLTPEYLVDLPGFSRRFLRGAFALLNSECLLVFDNYHEIAADSNLHAAFAACLEEVPRDANVIVVSRSDPPPAFARALINGSVSRIDWEELRLTRSETAVISAARGVSGETQVDVLHEQSSGWLAGVVLMAEGMHNAEDIHEVTRSENLETVFDYFAGQILDKVSEETRNVLVRTALLPRVTAPIARSITGMEDAIAHVEQMYRRRLFTDRTQSPDASYQYHALFRAFLLERANAILSVQERRILSARAAAELEASGDVDGAFALFAQANEWAEAERMFVIHAGALIGQGRWKTLRQWSEMLPADRGQINPWLGYWLGRSMTTVDPPAARNLLETAHDVFVSRDDRQGQLLCGAGILEALYYQYDEFRTMDRWIERTAEHLECSVAFDSMEDELWVNAVFAVAATYRLPGHPMLRKSVARVSTMLPDRLDANLKVTAATMLHFYAYNAFDVQAAELATREARPLLASSQLTAQRAALYLGEEGYSHYINGRYSQALECLREGDSVAQASGLNELVVRLNQWRGFCQRRAGMLEEAESTLRRLELLAKPAHGIRPALFHCLQAYVLFDRGDIDGALALSLPAQEACEASGQMLAIMLMRIINAEIAIAGGRFDLADELLERTEGDILGTVLEHQRAAIMLNRAWRAHRSGDPATTEILLREALVLSHGERERTCMRWYRRALSDLLPVALEREIEPEAARRLIRESGVLPGAPASEKWPWPVKVHTLGRFELLVDDRPPEFSRKSPKRVLTLLKAIIALGGTDVPEQRLVDLLWPEQEGDAAHDAISALLHRLRGLVGSGDAIRQRGGSISIDPTRCWVDVFAFEQRLESPEPEHLEKAIDLYRGGFLAQEDDLPWVLPMREKLRARFIEAVARHAEELERAGRHGDAARCYARGIETDDLVEPFYQGLMRCYGRLDRRAEAAGAYQRLRQTLSIRLGSRPSSSTEHLYQSIRLN